MGRLAALAEFWMNCEEETGGEPAADGSNVGTMGVIMS